MSCLIKFKQPSNELKKYEVVCSARLFKIILPYYIFLDLPFMIFCCFFPCLFLCIIDDQSRDSRPFKHFVLSYCTIQITHTIEPVNFTDTLFSLYPETISDYRNYVHKNLTTHNINYLCLLGATVCWMSLYRYSNPTTKCVPGYTKTSIFQSSFQCY